MGTSQKNVVWAATRIKNLINQIFFTSIAILISGTVISSQVSAQGTDSQQNEFPVADSVPVISIAAKYASSFSNGYVVFSLTASTTLDAPVTVRVNISETSRVIKNPIGERAVTIDANSSVKDLYLESALINHDIETNPVITATLLNDNNTPATYTVSSVIAEQSANVTVFKRDELPEFRIYSLLQSTMEGRSTNFALYSTEVTAPVSVRVSVSQTGDVLSGGSEIRIITFPAFTRRITFQISTEDDEVSEPQSIVSVTLLVDDQIPETYTIYDNPSFLTADTVVRDNDSVGIVSVTPVESSVVESSRWAKFRISLEIYTNSTITVRYNISQTGDVLWGAAGNSVTTLSGYPRERVVQVLINDDLITETDGIITLTLLEDDNSNATYSITSDVSKQSAQVIVIDDDASQGLPIVNLSTSTPSVSEGDDAKITFILDRAAPTGGLSVSYTISEIGDYLFNYSVRTHNINFLAGESTKIITVGVKNDHSNEANGSFTVSLNRDSVYLNGTTSTLTVNLIDDDSPPYIVILDAKAIYSNRGAEAEFTLGSWGFFSGVKSINVAVSGVVTTIAIPSKVSMTGIGRGLRDHNLGNNGNGIEAVLRIPIHEDQISSQTGKITVSILPPTNTREYLIGSHSLRHLNISEFSVSSTTLPEISISTISERTYGTDRYFFRITASHASNTPLKINYNSEILTGKHSYLSRPGSFTLPAGRTYYELTISSLTYASFFSENVFDGEASVLLKSGIGYVVAPSPHNFAKTNLRRYNEPTGISIVADDYVVEGKHSHVTFQVSSSNVTQTDRIIDISVSEHQSSVLGQTGPIKLILPAGESFTTLDVPIIDNDVIEPNGEITATILAGTGYTVGTTKNEATIKIMDNDGLPVIYIEPVYNLDEIWYEGEYKNVSLHSAGKFNGTIEVRFRVTDNGGNLYRGLENRTANWDSTSWGRIHVRTNDDSIAEEDGIINVEILPGEGYAVSTELGRASFTVLDNDSPTEISLEVIESTITEGQYAQFRLTPADVRLYHYLVKYSVSQGGGDFINSEFQHGKNIVENTISGYVGYYASRPTAIIRIPTVDDNIDEADGEITLTLLPIEGSTAYALASDVSQNSVSVIVLDNEETPESPTMSISTNTNEVVEGGTATITIASSLVASTSGLVVNYEKSQSGNFFATSFAGSGSATILEGELTKDIEFNTHDDNVDEPDGSFTITLSSSSNYTLGSTSSITVNVTDNDDTPVISIAGAPAVVEGTDSHAVFTLTASNPASELTTIKVLVTGANAYLTGDQNSYITDAQISMTATLLANSTTTSLSVPIHDDEVYFLTSEIDVTLLPDDVTPATYTISTDSTNQSATATVNNDDALPVLSITAVSAEVTEPNPAQFRLTSPTSFPVNFYFGFNVSQTEYVFRNWSLNNTIVTIPAFATEFILDVHPENDEIVEPVGTITVTLRELESSYNYNINPDPALQSAKVTILDDDELQGDVPVVTLHNLTPDGLLEGDTGKIKFVLDRPAPANGLQVTYTYAKVGNYHNSFDENENRVVSIPAGVTSKVVSIRSNRYDESDQNRPGYGHVNFGLWPGTGYSIGRSSSTSAVIFVRDDRLVAPFPVVSLSASTNTLIEGETATITFSSNQAGSTNGIRVDYVKSQTGDFFASSFTGSDSATIWVRQTTKAIDFVTHDDNVDEADGSFTVSLVSNSRYSFGATSSVTVDVTDNDGSPVISIADATAVVEGIDSRAEFTLKASHPAKESREINVAISGATNFIQAIQIPTTVTLDANSTSAPLYIPIDDDVVDESNGIITVTLLADDVTPAKYTLNSDTTQHSAEVSVTDNDALPVFSIAPIEESVVESNPARFRVTSPTASSSQVTLRIHVAQTGNVIADTLGDTTTTVAALATEEIIDIATEDDEIDEDDGAIHVILYADDQTPATYAISTLAANQGTSVTVTDDDVTTGVPEVNISLSSTNISENQVFSLNFELDQDAPAAGLRVHYNVSETGDMLSSYSKGFNFVDIPAGESAIELKFRTTSDTVDEPNSTVTFALKEDSSYILGRSAVVETIVRDINSPPEITFVRSKAVYTGDGAYAEFILGSGRPFHGTRMINVAVNGVTRTVAGKEIPSFVPMIGERNKTSNLVNLITRSAEAVLRVPIHEEQVNEQTGQIEVTILAPTNPQDYSVGTPNSGQLRIADFNSSTSPLPEVSVAAIDRIAYGEEDYHFKISLSQALETSVQVNYYIFASNWYFNIHGSGGGDSVPTTIPAGETEHLITLPTLGHDVDGFGPKNVDGRAEISIESGSGYVVAASPNNYAEIEFRRYHEPEGISIVGDPVFEEGSTARHIQITASSATQSDRTVFVEVSDGDSDYLLQEGTIRVVIPAGETKAAFEVPLDNDLIDEPDGVITATILPRPGYTVSKVQNSVSIRVIDNDGSAVLYLSSYMGSDVQWEEGYTKQVSVFASAAPGEVRIRVTDGNTNLYQGEEIRTFNWTYSGWNFFQIPTNDDSVDEEDGTITVEILTSTNYEVASGYERATYTVYDNDEAPVIPVLSVSTNEIDVIEGVGANITFTSDQAAPANGLVVNYEKSQVGDFFPTNFAGTDTVTIGSGENFERIEFVANEDIIDEPNGSFTISLVESENYSLGSDSSITVNVIDNDELPELSIAAVTDSVVESNPAQFRITTPTASSSQITVKIHVGQTGNVIADTLGDKTTTIAAFATEEIIDIGD